MHPVLFELGDAVIRSYGVLLTAAFVTGILLALRRARIYGIAERNVVHAFALVLVSVVIGARLHYVADHLDLYTNDPWRVLRLAEGGLNMYGGALLAALVVLLYARRVGISFVSLAALFAAPLALGEAITRIGCFLNGCCFGVQCERAWAVVFPPGSMAGSVFAGVAVHPTQLYTAAASLAILAILLRLERRGVTAGKVLGAFLVLHGAMRLAVESVRYHAPSVLTVSIGDVSLTSAELVSLTLVALGAASLARKRPDRPVPSVSVCRLTESRGGSRHGPAIDRVGIEV
jgi:phosphatidylglycerol:prolipoprotein diacylglycerol transferase